MFINGPVLLMPHPHKNTGCFSIPPHVDSISECYSKNMNLKGVAERLYPLYNSGNGFSYIQHFDLVFAML